MYPGHWASVFPEKAAVIDAGNGKAISYGELNDRSNQLAQLMVDLGLRRGDHLSIFMENDIRYFIVVWAALRSGLYLTTVNRYLTDEEAAYIIDNSESQVVVASSYLKEVARELPAQCPGVRRWLMTDVPEPGYEGFDAALAEYPAKPLEKEPAGSFMLYSSGTTGRPKGILRPLPDTDISEDAGPVGALQQALWGFDENTVYLSPAPLYHSAPIGFCTATQVLGGSVVVLPRFDEVAALRAIQDYKVTHSQWVPTMFSRMLKLDDETRNQFDLSSHKVAIHAAAPCPRQVKQQMFDWWGPIIYEYYGGTELNGLTHVTPEAWLDKPGTVGQPILGTIHICDEDGKELPPGEPGLVYFELPEMPFEYLKDAGKTKDAQHPEHPNWSALGDVGYVDDDGFLFLTDRATFMIISGGVNIYPQEIEDALIVHPKVADVAVVGVPNDEMGEEVKAVVQPASGIEGDEALEEELLEYAREHIAHYKCPRSIDFEDELPRLPTGKLYKRILKDRYWGKNGLADRVAHMRAMLLDRICDLSVEEEPLRADDIDMPQPNPGEVRLEVSVCAVCHTELDEIEGRTPPSEFPVVPGHQVVGVIDAVGDDVDSVETGDRVGVGWIFSACGDCEHCLAGNENVCDGFVATGRDRHGGYAEYMCVPADFTVPVPDGLKDSAAAPLFCAGAIGYRSLKLTNIENGQRLGLTGFGASAHLVLQLARYQYPDSDVFVFARSEKEQQFARDLGAVWAGGTQDAPPERLHAVIDTTPAWLPIVAALEHLEPGGRLVVNAIRKEPGDQEALLDLDYPKHLWLEKEIKSVANVTRRDIRELLEIAAEIGIDPTVEHFNLADANKALLQVKRGQIRGAKILDLGSDPPKTIWSNHGDPQRKM